MMSYWILLVLLLSLDHVLGQEDEKPKYSKEDQKDQFMKYKPEDRPTEIAKERELEAFCKDVVIILQTVNENEFQAALTYMKPPSENFKKAVIFPMTSMVVGMFANKKVALIRTKPGEKVTDFVEDAIEEYPNANFVIGVGVCYAFDSAKVKLGDVLISEKINDNVNMKYTSTGDIEYRGQSVDVPHQLQKIFGLPSELTDYVVSDSEREAHVYSGTFCCDDVLVNNKEQREKYHKANPTAIGGEMEGGKLLKFVQSKRRKLEGVIVIKGVADYADGKKNKEWQFTAAMAALHYTESQLRNVPLKELQPSGQGPQPMSGTLPKDSAHAGTTQDKTDDAYKPNLKQQLYDKLYEHISPGGSESFYIHETGLMWDSDPQTYQMVSTMPSYIEEGKNPSYTFSGDAIYDAYSNALTSVKITMSPEMEEELEKIKKRVSDLEAKREDNYDKLYKEEKCSDPECESITERSIHWTKLHGNDDEINKLKEKIKRIEFADDFKENEAIAALRNKAGHVDMVDSSGQVPNFIVRPNANEWRNKVANGKGNVVTITLSNIHTYGSKSKFRVDPKSKISIYRSNVSGGGEMESFNLGKDETSINIEFEALDTINVTPDPQWYLSAYLKQQGGLEKWKAGKTTKEVFGPQGFHSIVTGLVVCYRPSITITTSTSSLNKIKALASGTAEFSIGPFSFGGSGSYEDTPTYTNEEGKGSFTIKSESDYGRILGVIVKNPYYG